MRFSELRLRNFRKHSLSGENLDNSERSAADLRQLLNPRPSRNEGGGLVSDVKTAIWRKPLDAPDTRESERKINQIVYHRRGITLNEMAIVGSQRGCKAA